MTRWCPNCRAGWPDPRSTCVTCLAELVDDPDATVTCQYCDRVWPARMQSCPQCLAELRPDPEAAALGLTDLLAAGRPLPRPADVAAFADGPDCTLLRTSARSALIYAGPLEWMEAYVRSRDNAAVAPLEGCDIDGTLLFRLVDDPESHGGLAAVEPDGTPLASFLPREGEIDVRDETGTLVAHAQQTLGGWQLVQPGSGHHLADLLVAEVTLDDAHVDDEWTLRVHRDLPVPLPLKPFAAVALPLAGKVLGGRARPGSPPRPSMTPETVT